ncbi:uncharacterized protein LOC135833024 isoform X2 [Planococcus citri]|uniref:uncharacterized protein LOC135833024 isoform X2 n=1 Tax=Planococcus citri TaxID=170843 RepID=UPI0031F7E711
MLMITDYICSPDWSMFYDEGNSTIWQLKNIIQNEVIMASSAFTHSYHTNCASMFFSIRDEILSMIESWSNALYVYSNYISAALSDIFNDKMKMIISKYQYYPSNNSFKWLCDELMLNCGYNHWDHIQTHPSDENQFWFINETMKLHFFEEPFVTHCPYEYPGQSEEELVVMLSQWLFRESINQLQSDTKRLVLSEYDAAISEDLRVLRKEQLSSYLNKPVINLELQMKTYSNDFSFNFNVSDGPHYFIPDGFFTELHPGTKSVHDYFPYQCGENDNKNEVSRNFMESETSSNIDQYYDDERSNFDLIDSIVSNKGVVNDTEYGCKLSNIKEELETYCTNDAKIMDEDSKSNASNVTIQKTEETHDKTSPVPKLQIKGRHEALKHDTYPAVQHKKRGRPKKIEDYSSNAPKNGQHKYSPEDVQDCSIWISDNFFEVAGNKPAIDRARMYELYTNYCLLKLCTPVDRALFGKIIRKVFPKLKSRRLIQNQVLKYHYVGLKPKYTELEQALLYSDSTSMNPSEILVTYVPVEESR